MPLAETLFNVVYLLTIWALIGLMALRRRVVAPAERPLARRLTWAFAALGTGDLGHVGFRVLALLRGGLTENAALLGAGSFATAVTFTVFYLCMLDAWRVRFERRYQGLALGLMAMAVLRFALLLPSANQWTRAVPPLDWSIYRNLPLFFLGLGVAFLLLRDAPRSERALRALGWLIVASYVFFTPVVFLAPLYPALGVLMVPKTVLYVVMAVVMCRRYWRPAS